MISQLKDSYMFDQKDLEQFKKGGVGVWLTLKKHKDFSSGSGGDQSHRGNKKRKRGLSIFANK